MHYFASQFLCKCQVLKKHKAAFRPVLLQGYLITVYHELANFRLLWRTKRITSSAQCRVSATLYTGPSVKGDSNCFHLRGCTSSALPGRQTALNDKDLVSQTTAAKYRTSIRMFFGKNTAQRKDMVSWISSRQQSSDRTQTGANQAQ